MLISQSGTCQRASHLGRRELRERERGGRCAVAMVCLDEAYATQGLGPGIRSRQQEERFMPQLMELVDELGSLALFAALSRP